MATFSKYNDFVEQLCNAVHNFSSHTFKVALSNGTPSAAHTTLSAITELSTANGYTAGGVATTIGVSETSGTVTVTATDPTAWTASGAGITFRYAALYNDTSASDNLVAYWDNGSSTTVTSGNTLQIDFGSSLFTLV
jgi:hypothetical protein